MRSNRFAYLLALATILSLFLFCGCLDNTETETIWFEVGYRTNDVEVAQQETPFNIVLPTYVPDDLDPVPYIEGRSKDYFRDDWPITILYYKCEPDPDDENMRYATTPLWIEESNREITALPSGDSVYLTISGIEVLEEEFESFWPTDLKHFPWLST